MANPFLVLGGIAVGIVTAAFGVLAVPGWVASAQDAAAVDDLASIRQIQAAAASSAGDFIASIGELELSELGMSFSPSASSELVNLSAKNKTWCAVVKSGSGTFYAASSVDREMKTAGSAEAAGELAGCDTRPVTTFVLNCPATTSFKLPVTGANGTLVWSNGDTEPISGSGRYQTRDTFGSAIKATWVEVDGEGRNIQKNPATDNGLKKSATGRLAVATDATGELTLIQQATPEQEAASLLQPVWEDGRFLRYQSFADVRATLAAGRQAA